MEGLEGEQDWGTRCEVPKESIKNYVIKFFFLPKLWARLLGFAHKKKKDVLFQRQSGSRLQ